MKKTKLAVGILFVILLFSLAFTAMAETRESKAGLCTGTKWKNIFTLDNGKITKGKHESLVGAINQGCDFKVVSIYPSDTPQSFAFNCSYVHGGTFASETKHKYFDCREPLRGDVNYYADFKTDLTFAGNFFYLDLDPNNVVNENETAITGFGFAEVQHTGEPQKLSMDRTIKVFVR